MSNLVEIDRGALIEMSTTPYVRVSQNIKKRFDLKRGDEYVVLQAPDSDDLIIRFTGKGRETKDKDSKHTTSSQSAAKRAS